MASIKTTHLKEPHPYVVNNCSSTAFTCTPLLLTSKRLSSGPEAGSKLHVGNGCSSKREMLNGKY